MKHGSSSGTAISDYSYDRYGNRWQQTSYNGGLTTALSFNSANNQINSSGYVYDAAGNLTQDPNHSYQYDDDGKLLSVDDGATASYIYDAFNQRVKFADIRGIYRCGFDLFSRRATIWYDNGTTALSQYYAGDSPIAYWLNGDIYYQHQDLVGTERVRTNKSGTGAVAQFQSAEFGDNYTTPSSDTNLPHFAGTDHDLGQGNFTLEHAAFREYAPSYGRWMSPDPYDGSYNIFDPQSFNRYSYVQNNPLALNDPLGLESGCVRSTISYYDDNGVAHAIPVNPDPRCFNWDDMGGGDKLGRPSWRFADGIMGGYSVGTNVCSVPLAPSKVSVNTNIKGQAGTSTPEWGNWRGGPPYGDDPNDQAQIIAGYNYYKSGCYKKT
ncbi:RHS repeat domain-containing protein [Terriglobus sp. YAF25]|uniref:RHS repeat domain-containing protein n=1 Tax=Terriglobus sp. YAF25 TaxID=3233080 RepID=UPI003F966275